MACGIERRKTNKIPFYKASMTQTNLWSERRAALNDARQTRYRLTKHRWRRKTYGVNGVWHWTAQDNQDIVWRNIDDAEEPMEWIACGIERRKTNNISFDKTSTTQKNLWSEWRVALNDARQTRYRLTKHRRRRRTYGVNGGLISWAARPLGAHVKSLGGTLYEACRSESGPQGAPTLSPKIDRSLSASHRCWFTASLDNSNLLDVWRWGWGVSRVVPGQKNMNIIPSPPSQRSLCLASLAQRGLGVWHEKERRSRGDGHQGCDSSITNVYIWLPRELGHKVGQLDNAVKNIIFTYISKRCLSQVGLTLNSFWGSPPDKGEHPAISWPGILHGADSSEGSYGRFPIQDSGNFNRVPG